MNKTLKEQIVDLFRRCGADLVRFGNAERCGDPAVKTIFPQTKTVICAAFRQLRGSRRGIEEGSTYYQYTTTAVEVLEENVMPTALLRVCALLEDNGFLVRQAGGRYTTYVKFSPESYSLERQEHVLKKQLAIARRLAEEYVPAVRAAVSDVRQVWIPGKNRELLEAAAVFYGVANKCLLPVKRDLSPYQIRTQAGGHFIAFVELPAEQTDPDYVPTLRLPSMWTCGDMNRWSGKYPVEAWSVDTRYCSRTGGWEDNRTSDYEYLYEFFTGAIADNRANEEKFRRLRKRGYLSEDNRVQVMVVKGSRQSFFDKIPGLEAAQIDVRQIADGALELAQTQAEEYPPQMRDLVISWNAGGFISNTVALMVLDCLYESGAFRPLTEPERVTSQLLVFSDTPVTGTSVCSSIIIMLNSLLSLPLVLVAVTVKVEVPAAVGVPVIVPSLFSVKPSGKPLALHVMLLPVASSVAV